MNQLQVAFCMVNWWLTLHSYVHIVHRNCISYHRTHSVVVKNIPDSYFIDEK